MSKRYELRWPNSVSTAPEKHIRTPWLIGLPRNMYTEVKTYWIRSLYTMSNADGRHVRLLWNTYPPRVDTCKSEDVGKDVGEADPYQRWAGGSESTGRGNASYVTSGQP